jgi:hydrogen peroxide-dependent heme synthase
MPEALVPAEGWGVLHLFCKVRPGLDAEAVRTAVKTAVGDDHQVVPVALLGHKADLGLVAIGPDLWRLRALQSDVQAAGLEVVASYVSLTEVSEYAEGVPDKAKRARLYPVLPPDGMPAFCFYPMTKRRAVGQNWYALPYEQRLELMYDHGKSGRRFAGRVVQLVTGSTGLDDFEWGVTLFAKSPDVIKDVVYTMRFDKGSALYGEFGTFYVGYLDFIDNIL